VIYEVASARLQYQFSFADTVNNKVSAIFGWGAGTIAVLTAVLILGPVPLHGGQYTIFAIATAAYITLAIATVISSFSRGWSIGPEVSALLAEAQSSGDERQMRWRVAHQLSKAYHCNVPAHKTQVRCLKVAIAAIILQVCALIAALSLTAAAAPHPSPKSPSDKAAPLSASLHPSSASLARPAPARARPQACGGA
jgi:hypothetical protein